MPNCPLQICINLVYSVNGVWVCVWRDVINSCALGLIFRSDFNVQLMVLIGINCDLFVSIFHIVNMKAMRVFYGVVLLLAFKFVFVKPDSFVGFSPGWAGP